MSEEKDDSPKISVKAILALIGAVGGGGGGLAWLTATYLKVETTAVASEKNTAAIEEFRKGFAQMQTDIAVIRTKMEILVNEQEKSMGSHRRR